MQTDPAASRLSGGGGGGGGVMGEWAVIDNARRYISFQGGLSQMTTGCH